MISGRANTNEYNMMRLGESKLLHSAMLDKRYSNHPRPYFRLVTEFLYCATFDKHYRLHTIKEKMNINVLS